MTTEMIEIESKYLNMMSEDVKNGVSPFAIAASMAKLSMMIYRTALNDEDYNAMIDTLSQSRNRIKAFIEIPSNRLN